VIERAAQDAGALVLDLSGFGARNLLMADHVHPTAFGQIYIAERALDVLARDGMTVVARPSQLIAYETTWWKRLRGDATYTYRHTKVSVGSAIKLARLQLRKLPG
jgi:phospholipase/lecithinase/hemolysin